MASTTRDYWIGVASIVFAQLMLFACCAAILLILAYKEPNWLDDKQFAIPIAACLFAACLAISLLGRLHLRMKRDRQIGAPMSASSNRATPE